MQKDIYYN